MNKNPFDRDFGTPYLVTHSRTDNARWIVSGGLKNVAYIEVAVSPAAQNQEDHVTYHLECREAITDARGWKAIIEAMQAAHKYGEAAARDLAGVISRTTPE